MMMNIYNINNNKLLISNEKNNHIKVVNTLIELKLDTAIIYDKIVDNQFNIIILEKDYSYSNMCGNGCIAMCLHFKKDLILFNNKNEKIKVFYEDNEIKLDVPVINTEKNIYLVANEPHKVYIVKNYSIEEHIKKGKENLPNYNTTFIIYSNNKYYYKTYERGVNDFTQSCGTGAVACAYFLNKNIKKIYTFNNDIYTFKLIKHKYFLIYKL